MTRPARTIAGGKVRRRFPWLSSRPLPADPWGEVRAVEGRILFTDRTARVWRIYDLAGATGARTKVPVGSPQATARAFVSPAGARYVYAFRRRERHEATPSRLALQLEEAMRTPAAPRAPGGPP